MKTYHYVIMDYEGGFVKLGKIEANKAEDAVMHLKTGSNEVMVSLNKIPMYNNKNLLSTNDDT